MFGLNYLSTLLYLSEISDRFSGLSVLAGIFLLVVAVAFAVIAAIESDNRPNWGKYKDKGDRWRDLFAWGKAITCIIVAWVFFVVSALLPSKETIRMIAASQAAGYIAQTNTAKVLGSEAVDTLRSLMGQLRDGKSK